MDKFTNQLKIAFASQYAFALKAQNFHWNVEGPDFYQLHKLFEDIYNEVYDSIDDFAENIRKIKAYTPASLTRFSTLTEIDDESGVLMPESMVSELLLDAEKMQEIMKVLFVESEANKEYGLSDFIAGRQDAFAKHAWFLRATLKA
jgi:starvation-inducible DNA-binding protein